MKKNNNKVTNVKEIPMFSSEEIPFSRMNSSGFKRGHNIYRVDYINKNGENKTSYVKYEGFSTKGT